MKELELELEKMKQMSIQSKKNYEKTLDTSDLMGSYINSLDTIYIGTHLS